MIDLELFGGFDFTQTNGQTDERTFGVVESLSRLKIILRGSLQKSIFTDIIQIEVVFF